MDLKNYEPRLVPEPNGFRNPGSSCYFNVVLQSIISCPSFAQVLIKNRDANEYKANPVVGYLLIMYDLIFKADPDVGDHQRANLLDEIAVYIWKAVFDKAIMREDSVKFTKGQECAREGFHLLLESLDGLKEIETLFLHRYQTLIFCPDCDEWVVDAKCEYTVFEVQPSLTSPQLPIFASIDPNYRKRQPMDQFLKKQNSYVDRDFKCPKCKKPGPMFQTTRLIMIPEILVVMSKKYAGMQKSHDVTAFPEIMMFDGKDPDATESNPEIIPMVYQAVSRIEHMGGMHGGHYNCHAMRAGRKWFRLDDSQIADGGFASTPNTYMVFYHIQ
jgi:ubiquitin C-terminal hydrolase